MKSLPTFSIFDKRVAATIQSDRLKRFSRIVAIGILALAALAPAVISAASVTRILNVEEFPSNYVVYQHSLYYSNGGRMFRLDDINGPSQEIVFPDFSENDRVNIKVFDNSLFITYNDALYRLSGRDTVPEKIDVQVAPSYDWMDDGFTNIERFVRPYGKLAVYDGSLYFLALAPRRACGFTELTNLMFRIDSAFSTPRQIKFQSEACESIDFHNLSGTEVGLVYKDVFGDPRGMPIPILGWLKRPQLYEENLPNGVGGSYIGFWYSTAVFDGHIFLGHVKENNEIQPGIGETELLRLNPISLERQVYEINPDIFSFSDDDFNAASSYPSHFAVANDVLYFRASADGESTDLYRMTSADAQPEVIQLNPNGPAEAQPFGQYLDRLWFAADTGAGFDIHYFANDGTSAIPLGVDESIARSALNFTQYKDQLVFSGIVTNDKGKGGKTEPAWGTYLVSIDSFVPCTKPACGCDKSCAKSLRSRLTINNAEYPLRPGFIARPGYRLKLRCELTNASKRSMEVVRVAINDSRRYKKRTKTRSIGVCKRNVIAPGQTLSCQRTVRALPGNHRYSCVSRAVAPDGKPQRLRTQAIVRVRR